jgi:hypothetical protein
MSIYVINLYVNNKNCGGGDRERGKFVSFISIKIKGKTHTDG